VQAATWIDENCGEPLTLGDIATRADLSPWHFLKTFAKVVGVTPHQYLLRARLRAAARRLAGESQSVTEVAFDAGFADLSNFMRTFRRAAGMSPLQFRRLARGDQQRSIGRIGAVAGAA
jgi:AraC-like DNA-binding protein